MTKKQKTERVTFKLNRKWVETYIDPLLKTTAARNSRAAIIREAITVLRKQYLKDKETPFGKVSIPTITEEKH